MAGRGGGAGKRVGAHRGCETGQLYEELQLHPWRTTSPEEASIFFLGIDALGQQCNSALITGHQGRHFQSGSRDMSEDVQSKTVNHSDTVCDVAPHGSPILELALRSFRSAVLIFGQCHEAVFRVGFSSGHVSSITRLFAFFCKSLRYSAPVPGAANYVTQAMYVDVRRRSVWMPLLLALPEGSLGHVGRCPSLPRKPPSPPGSICPAQPSTKQE